MAAINKVLPAETTWARIRRAALWLLFASVLLIPKTLSLRRRPTVWNTARLIAALLGAALLAASWAGVPHATGAAVAGAVLLILALAIPPERRRSSPAALNDARAKELGAVIVVRGGSYRGADGVVTETRIFVGPERLWIFATNKGATNGGPADEPLFEVPVAGLTIHAEPEGHAEPESDGWKLCLAWDASTAEFLYHGPFAEHFARVAESTVRSQISPALPILR